MSYEDALYESWEDYLDQKEYLESIAPVVGASAAYAESEYTKTTSSQSESWIRHYLKMH